MAAVPFGFSFGDFVAAIEVIHKAAQALRRSAGARSQIIQAAADLESFERVLRKVQTLTPDTVNPDTLAAIRLCAYACHLPLGHFVQRMGRYERHLSQRHGSKPGFCNKIEKGYWKIRWALGVEEDVVKLKAAIGPGFATIETLLQVEAVEKGAATNVDIQHITQLAQRTVSLTEQVRLVLQQQTSSMDLRFDKLDNIATARTDDSRKILHHLPLLATHDQVRDLESKFDRLSTAVDSRAAADQAHHTESLLKELSVTHKRNHTQMSTQSLESVRQLQSTDRKVDELLTQMNHLFTTLSVSCTSPAEAVSRPVSSESRGEASQIDGFQPLCPRKRSLDIVNLFLELTRKFLCSMVFLLALLPSIRAQLRTCMTFLRSPLLLSGNSIILTDALNRTKLLPYEFFCDWKTLEPWLHRVFRNLPGESRVARGDFAMFKQYKRRTGPRIEIEQWERHVFAGDCVVMSILASSDRNKGKCRKCGAAWPSEGNDDVWQDCTDCGQSYCYVRAQDTESHSTPLPSARAHAQEGLSGPLPATSETQYSLDHDAEDENFARVHSIRFQAMAIRPLTPQEAWSLYHYETHARGCRLCSRSSLCDTGYGLAQDVQVLVCQHSGEICSTRPDSKGEWIRIEIPHVYSRAKSLLGIETKRSRKQAPIVRYDFDPRPPQRQRPKKNVYVEPARTHRDDGRLPERAKRGTIYERYTLQG